MSNHYTESHYENAILQLFQQLGCLLFTPKHNGGTL